MKYVYELDFKGSEEVIKRQAQLTLELKKTNEEIRKAQKSGNLPLYEGLLKSQVSLKSEIQKTNVEIRNQKKEFESSKLPNDSIKALELSYNKLKNEIKSLSEEERKSPFGKTLNSQLQTIRREVDRTKRSLGEFSKSYSSEFIGGLRGSIGVATGAGAAFALVGLATDSAKSLISIEKTFFQIQELTQASLQDVELYKKSLPGLATELGTSQEFLGRALLQINSAGITGANALNLAAKSAKLSALGFGEVNVVAQALSGTINAYGGDVVGISKAVDGLFKLVQQGTGDISGFANGFSKVTASGAQLNIPLEQIVANIANLTNKGTPAAEALTQLEAVFLALIKPTKEGQIALNSVNLSYEKLRDLAKIDLAKALDLVNERLGGNVEKLGEVFGRAESLRAVFSSTGKNADGLAKALEGVNNAASNADKSFEKLQETKGEKINRFFNSIKEGAITALASFIDFSEKFAKNYNKLIDIITFNKPKIQTPVSNDQFDKYGEDFLKQSELFDKQQQFDEIANAKIQLTEEEKRLLREKQLTAEREYNKAKLKLFDQQANDLEKISKRIGKVNDEALKNELETLIQLQTLQSTAQEQVSISPLQSKRTIDGSVKFVSTLLNVNQADFDKEQQKLKDKKEELEETIRQTALELANIGLDTLADLALTNLDNKQKLIDKEKEMSLQALEEEYNRRRDFAQGNFELITQLNREQAAEQERIEKEAAKRSQALNIKKAIIEGALAIVKTFAQVGFLAGLPLAILQAAATAKQVALIKAQGFAEGGQPQPRTGAGYVQGPGTTTSDSIPALLSNKEYVLNAKMVKLFGLEFLEAVRKSTLGFGRVVKHPAYIKRFAEGGSAQGGGFIPNLNLAPTNSNLNASAFIDRESMVNFGQTVAGIVADQVESALTKGLANANRRLEREEKQKQRSAA